jgi:5-methylcytosine-specific restriction endonuclease McrA
MATANFIEVTATVAGKAKTGQTAAKGASPSMGDSLPALPPVGVLTSPVLVLNLNYVPINVSTVRRAIILLSKGKAEILENHRGEVRTVSTIIDAPSIIRLIYLVKRPFAPRKLSKKEVFLRDKYTCQYCGEKKPDLTLDHVVPRRQHGPNTWENVVAACSRCNLHKAGRTPEEANMRLKTEPRTPQPNPYRILQNRTILDEWRPYLPWSIE